MEGIKTTDAKTLHQNPAEMITFISMQEVEAARKDLLMNKINDEAFSDGEIILAIQEKERLGASTIVPVVIDWLVQRNFIMTGAQAVKFLMEKNQNSAKNYSYQVVGDLDFDIDGKFYLIVASTYKRKMETIYKVYVHGTIKELWTEA